MSPEGGGAVRVALCGGPYANPYALAAFVEDARHRGCQRLYCLGDLGGFGAEVNALWPLLQSAEVSCVAGNYDVAIARGDPDCGCGYRDAEDNRYAQMIYDYTRAHTSAEFAAWMGRLPTERREHLGGVDVHLVHGSPLALNDFWWESLPEAEHRSRATASGADVICCTHSGIPWQRRVGESLVVNVGVIGKPANDGRREVWYTLLELSDGRASAELVPLPYDWPAQARSMRAAGLPEGFVETIETGWWTTCIEVLPPTERARGRFQLYRSSLSGRFLPVGGSWSETRTAQADPGGKERPVVPLFSSPYFPPRLWIYTNFHCNLACDYCAVGSSPRAQRLSISSARFRELVDQAVDEGFRELYLTGGEPLLHPQLPDLLDQATRRLPTTLLTNAMLLSGERLKPIAQLAPRGRLVIQTSLDGARAETHDRHRGRGSFVRTVKGIRAARDCGLSVRVAMTETPENSREVDDLRSLLVEMGVPSESFVVRPMLKRGFSREGLLIGPATTIPELTVSSSGVFWHPAGADPGASSDMVLAKGEMSLGRAKQLVTERFFASRLADGTLPQPYRCAI